MNFNESSKKPNFLSIGPIALAHIAVFALVIQGINGRMIFSPQLPPPISVIPIVPVPPPPVTKEIPPPSPDFLTKPPPVFVPEVEFEIPRATPTKDVPIAETSPHEVKSVATPDGPVMPQKLDIVKHQAVHLGAVVDGKNCEKPDYPRNALRNGDTGIVKLALLVGIDGRVHDSKIEKSSGFRELDNAAQTGLSLCKFKPASIDGVPQQTWATMEYVWKID